MPTFDELKARYMDAAPRVFPNCRVDPLIRASSYFPALKAQLTRSDVTFAYLTAWVSGVDHRLDTTGERLADVLMKQSREGVDVRVLGWVMAPEVLQNFAVQRTDVLKPLLRVNASTIRFIEALRKEPTLAPKAVLNILSHPAGAVHLKTAIIGSDNHAVGFTGGIDPEPERWEPYWHDVASQFSGVALQPLYNLIRDLWEEVRKRSPVKLSALRQSADSHSTAMPALPHRNVPLVSTGSMHVQNASTLPQYRFGAVGQHLYPVNQPLSFAPSGRVDVERVWQRGIVAAEHYIYVEDQLFTSAKVYEWINDVLRKQANLRCVLVIGGDDPTVPNSVALTTAMRHHINEKLLAGLSTADINDRVCFAAYPSLPSTHPNFRFVHTKSTIIDDNWAIIGSANFMQRSLYTDIEHSIAFMDEAGVGVPAYRTELWGHHLRATIPDFRNGLAEFFRLPFRTGAATNTTWLERLKLPIQPKPDFNQGLQAVYEELQDVDSRKVWSPSARALLGAGGVNVSAPGSGSTP